ncbi:MAG: GNAT family N-acetyltransferase [Micropepsaceae bacterium]
MKDTPMNDTVDIGIRMARPSDAAGIAGIYVDSWRETYAGILPTAALARMSKPDQEKAWDRTIQHASLRCPVFVASDVGSTLFGFASAGPNRDRSLAYDAEIYTLYVAPGFTGQGIGTAMMSSVFRLLSKAPCKGMVIWALAENPSRFFYEAMGGKLIAERRHPVWGATYREVAYAWETMEIMPRNTSANPNVESGNSY